MSRLVSLLVVGACLCACRSQLPEWIARIQPTCVQSTGSRALDRQRAFLASLLALDAKRYVILENHFPDRIVAHYVSSYQPEIHATRWMVEVLRNGKLSIRAVPPYDRHHDRSEDWYRRLVIEIQRYQCRELEWLSWSAESKGLLPIGTPVGVEPPTPTPSSFTEDS